MFDSQNSPGFQDYVLLDGESCSSDSSQQCVVLAESFVPIVIHQATNDVHIVLAQLVQNIVRVGGKVDDLFLWELLQVCVWSDLDL